MLVYNVPKRKELKKNKKKLSYLKMRVRSYKKENKKTFFYKLSDYRLVSHMTILKNLLYYTEKFVILYRKICYTIPKNLLYYTEKFVILYRKIRYTIPNNSL
jgi:hypothetical protein